MAVGKDIVWTRSIADWNEDRHLFGANETHVTRLPCIEISKYKTPNFVGITEQIGTTAPKYAVMTSTNAAKFSLSNELVLKALREVREIFTHGPSTAEILIAAGFHPTVIEVKTARDLGDNIKGKLPPGSSLIWPCGVDVAYDFTADLRAHGIAVHRVFLYVTKECATDSSGVPINEQARQKIIGTLSGVICFASPSAARTFIETFDPKSNRLAESLTAIAIGPTTSAAIGDHFRMTKVCSDSNLAELAAIACAASTER